MGQAETEAPAWLASKAGALSGLGMIAALALDFRTRGFALRVYFRFGFAGGTMGSPVAMPTTLVRVNASSGA
jgi:hypothetical protein